MAHPSPQSPYAQQPSQPYRASTRSRVIVWTIAIVVIGSLVAFLGVVALRTVKDMTRDDKVLGTCHQEARSRIQKGAAEANFTDESVSYSADRTLVAYGVMDFRGDRKHYVCVVYLDGQRWAVREFRFED
jgi:hypothetical protein